MICDMKVKQWRQIDRANRDLATIKKVSSTTNKWLRMSVELERETGDRLEGINQDKCCVTCYWDRQSKAICVNSTSKIFFAVAVISAIYVIASAIGIWFAFLSNFLLQHPFQIKKISRFACQFQKKIPND